MATYTTGGKKSSATTCTITNTIVTIAPNPTGTWTPSQTVNWPQNTIDFTNAQYAVMYGPNTNPIYRMGLLETCLFLNIQTTDIIVKTRIDLTKTRIGKIIDKIIDCIENFIMTIINKFRKDKNGSL